MRASQAFSRIPAFSSALSVKSSSLSAVRLWLILNLAITLFLSFRLNLWLDEAYTLHTTGQGFWHALKQAIYFELQPPLYFVLLSLWRKLNSTIFFARLPSVICIALTIKVVAALSKRFLKEINSAWVVACVASSPFMIWAAVEMRVYALVILMSGLLLLFFYDGFLEEPSHHASRWLYVLVSILALYTQYYVGFLLLANACALLVLRRWRSLAWYLAGMVIVAIALAPVVNIIRYQVFTHVLSDSVRLTVWGSVGHIYWVIHEYLLPVDWAPFYFLRRWVLRLGLVTLVLLVITKYRHRVTANSFAIWTIALSLTLALIVVQRLTAAGLVQERHTAALFLPITLAAFLLVKTVAQRKLVLGWIFLVLIFNGTTLFGRYAVLAKNGDWIRVADHISTSEKPGQPVLVFHASSALSLAQYYKGQNLLVPVPYEPGITSNYSPVGRPIDESRIAEAFKPVSERLEVWLVTDWTRGFRDEGIDDPNLNDFVRRTYFVERETKFYKSKVFLLRLKSPSKETATH